MLNDKAYQILKWVAIVLLPSLTTFVAVILKVWKIVDDSTINAIVTSMTALSTLIGGLIGVSTINYNAKLDDKGE